MEWTKIKAKYFLKPYSQMSLIEHGALARILVLTAYFERIPTQKEMLGQVPVNVLRALDECCATSPRGLEGVLEKVLEDVSSVKHKREISKATSKTYREKHKSYPQGSDASRDTTEKRREEKSILNPPATPDPSKQISLKDIEIKDQTESVKHKIFNQIIDAFKVRGWKTDPEYVKNVFKAIVARLEDYSPKDFFPYFKKAALNYINQNAEAFAADARIRRSQEKKIGVTIGGMTV